MVGLFVLEWIKINQKNRDAQIFWLKNRCPGKWHDRREIKKNHSSSEGSDKV